MLRVAAFLISVAIIVALIDAFRRDGPAALIVWRNADLKPGWIVLATLLGLLGHAVFVLGWCRLLRDCGVNVGFLLTARIFLISSLGRYLPAGKAWQMSIVAMMAKKAGLPGAVLASTSLFQGAVGVVVGAILLTTTGGALLGVAPVLSLVPLSGIIALIVLPQVLRWLPRIAQPFVNRFPSVMGISSKTMWMQVWTAGLNWIAWGLSLYALAMALLPDAAVASAIIYIAAWDRPVHWRNGGYRRSGRSWRTGGIYAYDARCRRTSLGQRTRACRRLPCMDHPIRHRFCGSDPRGAKIYTACFHRIGNVGKRLRSLANKRVKLTGG
jgi:hypothetical protein